MPNGLPSYPGFPPGFELNLPGTDPETGEYREDMPYGEWIHTKEAEEVAKREEAYRQRILAWQKWIREHPQGAPFTGEGLKILLSMLKPYYAFFGLLGIILIWRRFR